MEKQEKSRWMIKIFLKKAHSTKLFILYMGFIVVTACNAQKTTIMKKFDIGKFNEHKDTIRYEYYQTLENGTVITQREDNDEYIEIIKYKDKYIQGFNSYYKNGKLKITVQQLQKNDFEFPLELQLNYATKDAEIIDFEIIKKKETFEIETSEKPVSIDLDPNTNLLFEEAL